MNSLLRKIEDHINDQIVNQRSVGGGCIAQTTMLETISGKTYFLKSGFSNGIFLNEANGLNELRKADCIRIPQVIAVDQQFLLLEHIRSGAKANSFFIEFGQQFASLHQFTSQQFGFYENNFIGASPQINTSKEQPEQDWTDFYFNNRLLYQFKLAERNGYSDEDFRNLFIKIEHLIKSILNESDEAPTLLHGDLWGGNYMVDENGKAVLIDPAVYYGHREADLAMTKLFGGFNTDFYRSYNSSYPLKEGYEYRENIYLLYHVLNHLNLFGLSYKSQAVQLMKSYL